MIRTRIKCCGMTNAEDIRQAVALGVDALGFIFYPGSPRCIDLTKAKVFMADIPAFVSIVAVMVNPTAEAVDGLLKALPVQYLQFHGDESAAFCDQFQFPYIKAVPARNSAEILSKIEDFQSASAILLETPGIQGYGGSGRSFDWDILPEKPDKPLIVAGGLSPENIAELIQQKQPYAVDVNSAVEQYPGKKDFAKMQEFIRIVRKSDEQQ